MPDLEAGSGRGGCGVGSGVGGRVGGSGISSSGVSSGGAAWVADMEGLSVCLEAFFGSNILEIVGTAVGGILGRSSHGSSPRETLERVRGCILTTYERVSCDEGRNGLVRSILNWILETRLKLLQRGERTTKRLSTALPCGRAFPGAVRRLRASKLGVMRNFMVSKKERKVGSDPQ